MRKRTSLIVTLLVLFAAVVFAAGYAVAAMQPHPQHEASWNELVARGLIEGDADYYSMGFATEQEYYHALATAILAVDDKAGSSFRPIVPLPTSTTTTLPPTTAPSPTSTVAPSSTTTSSSTTTTTLTPTTTTTLTPSTTTSTTGPPTTSSTTTSTTTTTTTLPPPTTTTTTTTAPPPADGPVVTIVAGIHQDWSVEVMEDTSYLCEDGAILDGGGTVEFAFYGTADNVTIDGCEIRNYDNPAQHGAINAAKQTVDDADGWTITNNEIHHNWGAGIYLSGKDFLIANNHIHHQHQLGIAVNTGPGVIENNEIAWNNYEVDYNWGWEAGGSKFWATDGLIVRGNYSHDNHGPGLWDDYDNVNILYEDNIVEDNYGPGIFHEIGYTAIIRNNEVRRNGFGHDAWVWGPGISIASSQNTEVYGNIVEGNYNAITLVDQCRGVGDFDFNGQDWHSKNNYIHDNVIINSGLTGGATDCGYEEMFDPGVNVFENNTYTNGAWAWDHTTRSWPEWLGYHPNDGP